MGGIMPNRQVGRAPLGYSLKMASLKSPLEQPALYYSTVIAPWLKSVATPHYSGVAFENKYQLEAVRRLARPGMHCIDVGAHAGFFLRAFEKSAPGGAHVAVEPVPWKAAMLRSKFPNVNVIECALGALPGEAPFVEILQRSGASSLSDYAPERSAAQETVEYAVEVKTLDEIALEGPPVGLIKIDVEGAEGAVILGASRIIDRDRPALMFESGSPKHDKGGASDVFELLKYRFGYRLTAVRNFVYGKSIIDDRSAFDYVRQFPATAFNFVALPA